MTPLGLQPTMVFRVCLFLHENHVKLWASTLDGFAIVISVANEMTRVAGYLGAKSSGMCSSIISLLGQISSALSL